MYMHHSDANKETELGYHYEQSDLIVCVVRPLQSVGYNIGSGWCRLPANNATDRCCRPSIRKST